MARYGREYPPEHRPTYYRELPGDYSPAELGVLWSFGNPTPADFVATILDLARRGWILIEELRTEKPRRLGLGTVEVRDYRVWRRATPPRRDQMRPHEESLLGFLFGPGLGRGGADQAPPGVTGTFSRLDKAELPALALWDHYLVYAVSLGVAKEVIQQLPLAPAAGEVSPAPATGEVSPAAAVAAGRGARKCPG